jgi:hypothetical protein
VARFYPDSLSGGLRAEKVTSVVAFVALAPFPGRHRSRFAMPCASPPARVTTVAELDAISASSPVSAARYR